MKNKEELATFLGAVFCAAYPKITKEMIMCLLANYEYEQYHEGKTMASDKFKPREK